MPEGEAQEPDSKKPKLKENAEDQPPEANWQILKWNEIKEKQTVEVQKETKKCKCKSKSKSKSKS